MPRKGSLPSYRRHKQSGQAVVTLNDPAGRRRDVLLGPSGSYESKAEYARVIAEWHARRRDLPGPAPADITVNEVLLRFWAHVQGHYRRPDGTPTTEVENFRQALKPLRELYGHTQATAFGPLALKALRQTWVNAGLSRRFINQRVWRVKKAFKWAVGDELVPPAVFQALQSVEGLQQGRSAARELPRSGPCRPGTSTPSCPCSGRRFRPWSSCSGWPGCGRGRVCRLRWADIDRGEPVWVYRPAQHKTRHRAKVREILLGPRAQAVINAYRKDDPAAFLFSPREAVEALPRERTDKRVTKYYASRQGRQKRKAMPKRRPAECCMIQM